MHVPVLNSKHEWIKRSFCHLKILRYTSCTNLPNIKAQRTTSFIPHQQRIGNQCLRTCQEEPKLHNSGWKEKSESEIHYTEEAIWDPRMGLSSTCPYCRREATWCSVQRPALGWTKIRLATSSGFRMAAADTCLQDRIKVGFEETCHDENISLPLGLQRGDPRSTALKRI